MGLPGVDVQLQLAFSTLTMKRTPRFAYVQPFLHAH